MTDFDSSLIGATMSPAGLQGAGIDKTVLEMKAGSSTKSGSVPTVVGTTNQLYLLRVNGGSPTLSDFTLQGTAQGHLYNGLVLRSSTHASIHDIKIDSVPGDSDEPPGETFGINDSHGDGNVYDHVEIDGSGISGSNFATNSSNDVVVKNSYFHDAGSGHGATFWQTNNVTIDNVNSSDNKDCGFNFERVTGTVNMTDSTSRNNELCDIRIGNDQGSATYNIYNPVYSGSKLVIFLSPTYRGTTNLQQRSSIHVYVNGVDETNSVVQWKTTW